MTFDEAMKRLLDIEGRCWSNVAGDPGKETFYGISRVHWPEWRGWPRVDAGDLDGAAKFVPEFYRVNFWLPMLCDEVGGEVAFELFETAVNVGKHQAVKFLQGALNWAPGNDLVVDGEFGDKTMGALRRYDNRQILLKCMNGEQYIFYKNNPRHKRFRGWALRT